MCRDKGTKESEHLPKCNEGLVCNPQKEDSDVGICEKGGYYDFKFF